MTFNTKSAAQAVYTYDLAKQTIVEEGQVITSAFQYAGITYEVFMERKKEVISMLVTEQLSSNAESAKKMIERTLSELGIESPKSINAAAVKKDAQREKAKAEAEAFEKANAGKSISQLFEDSKAALELGNPKLATALNTLAIGKGDEKAKAVKAATQAKAKAVKAAIGKATFMQLEAIERILGISESKAAHEVAIGVAQETSVLQEALIKAKIVKAAKVK